MGPGSAVLLSLLAAALVTAILLSRGRFLDNISKSVAEAWPWLLLLMITNAAEVLFNRAVPLDAPLGTNITALTSSFLAGFPAWLQATLPEDPFVLIFGLVYILGLPFVLMAVPLTLAGRGDVRALRIYCLCLALAYCSGIALHLAFPSARPSLHPGSGILPLLYSDQVLGPLYSDLITPGRSFPSWHVTQLSAVLVVLLDKRNAAVMPAAVLILTMAGVMYLGVHWPADVLGGLILGAAAGLVSRELIKKWERR